MYYKILISKKWVPRGFVGLTIYPFIIFKKAASLDDVKLLTHEKIHIRQQLELLLVFFYLWYLLEFVIKFVWLRDKQLAYRAISFEREAYVHEGDRDYLKTRSFAAFIKYI
ncbi:hypothetical protein [Flavobacterium sp. JP2137]|uniref:hypothetical protein n=1 Tax=Flavobacterium sp. JP2137 TaxID=3414510 RepID=UPI003D2FA3F0